MSGKVLAKFELDLLTVERTMGRKDVDRWDLVDWAEPVFLLLPMLAVSLAVLLQVIFLLAHVAQSYLS